MRKLLVLLTILLSTSGVLLAQKTISGKVTDEKGDPISNVSVLAKGTNIGTLTKPDGTFTLNIPASTKTLVFSGVDLATRDVEINNQQTLVVALKQEDKLMSEVVVTGVGTATSKKKIAFAVESLTEKDLPKVPQASLDKALVGKIAGAQITSTSGQPGQQANIMLRGINSLGSTNPLIMVDGVEINAGSNNNGSGTNVTSRLSDLDLSNVERIEVIQGAAAATIYGAQGANGVIQIFTKKGKRDGQVRVNFNTRASFDEVLRGNLETAKNHFFNTDADGYIVNTSGTRLTQNSATKVWQTPGQPVLVNALNNKPYKEATYDNVASVFRNGAMTLNNSITISGGANKTDYALTLSNVNQESILFGRYKRTNVTLNLGTELFKNFSVRSITQLAHSDNTTGTISGQNNINSPIGSTINQYPFVNVAQKDSIGNYVVFPVTGQTSINPLYSQSKRAYSAKNTRIIQNVNLNYKPFTFLELDYKFGIDNYVDDFEDFISYQLNSLTPNSVLAPGNGSISKVNANETWMNSILSAFVRLDFEKDFNLNIPLTSTTHLAYDYRDKQYRSTSASGVGFAPYPPTTISTSASRSSSDNLEDFTTFGYLINQRFDYGNLFGLSAGFRSDYSSAFGRGSKPFTFPRGDLYFRISELLKNTNVLRELKVRSAYGKAGVQPGAYQRQITLASGTYGTNGYLASNTGASNPDLDVIVSSEFEAGADAVVKLGENAFSNIRLSATYWTKKSTGTIRAIDLAPSSGALTFVTNALDLESDGFQFSLDADILKKRNFEWDFGVRFGKSKTFVDKIINGKDIALGSTGAGEFVLREGTSVGSFFGVKPLTSLTQANSKGVRYISDADLPNYEVVNGYVVNKTTRAVSFTNEKEHIGDPNPKFNMTFLSNMTILKNFGLSFQIDWIYGNKIYNQTRQWMYRDLIHSDFDKEVTINGQTGAFVNYYSSMYLTNNTNSVFVEDGSFLRLRDLTLTYYLGDVLKKMQFLKNADISITGRNLFTITDYNGMDPEAAAAFNNPLRRGLDLYSFPNFRTFQVSLNLGF